MNHTTAQDKAQQTAEILFALGGSWSDTSEADNQTHTLTSSQGFGVRLHWDDHSTPSRIEVSGIWPKTQDGSELWPSQYEGGRPSITVASNRPAKAIAQAIVNRFLPVYLPIYDKMQDKANGQNAYAAQTEATTKAILGLPGVRQGHNGSGVYLTGYYPHTVTPQGKSVRFEAFSVPADVAVKILALMQSETPAED